MRKYGGFGQESHWNLNNGRKLRLLNSSRCPVGSTVYLSIHAYFLVHAAFLSEEVMLQIYLICQLSGVTDDQSSHLARLWLYLLQD